MTRRARNPFSYSRYSKHYVARNAEYRPDPNPNSYYMIPERYPGLYGDPRKDMHSNAPYPDGLVDISGITGPQVRRLSPGYLDRIFKGKSTVSSRQHYVLAVLENRRTPAANVDTVLRYVHDNPELFTPDVPSQYYSDDLNRVIMARNGSDADPDFLRRLGSRFPWRWTR